MVTLAVVIFTARAELLVYRVIDFLEEVIPLVALQLLLGVYAHHVEVGSDQDRRQTDKLLAVAPLCLN